MVSLENEYLMPLIIVAFLAMQYVEYMFEMGTYTNLNEFFNEHVFKIL